MLPTLKHFHFLFPLYFSLHRQNSMVMVVSIIHNSINCPPVHAISQTETKAIEQVIAIFNIVGEKLHCDGI